MLNSHSVILLFIVLGEVHIAVSASVGPVLHEAPDLPCSWRKAEHSLSEEHPVTVRLALKQQNLEILKELAVNVSDPRSTMYGQFLSTTEIQKLTAPEPAHIRAVEDWLVNAGVPFNRLSGGVTIEALFSVATASTLLKTEFHHASSDETRQHTMRAGDYWLPAHVDEAVAAVYGLHGLPAPPQKPLRSTGWVPPVARGLGLDATNHMIGIEAQPVDVTPDVIKATYQISGVTPSGSTMNRQAVAAFVNQQTSAEDLQKFFKDYVSSAPVKDASVYKFVGDNGTAGGAPGIEAELDIEYLMGVAPGVLTEFWYWGSDGGDMCADFKSWTDTILKDDAPLVHSVSYGSQGPLALDMWGCTQEIVNDIDTNLAKLAVLGITIIVASGDHGSGFTFCTKEAMLANTSIKGVVYQNTSFVPLQGWQDCCELARHANVTAWTLTAPTGEAQCSPKNGTAFEGTELYAMATHSEEICCTLASYGIGSGGGAGYTFTEATGNCVVFSEINGSKAQPLSSSSYATADLGGGVCSLFATVTGTAPTPGFTSGGDALKVAPKLFPAWPASSPWVTAVGATRFMDQKVGQPEIASEYFGSGGGFSTMYGAFKDQADVVSHYLQTAPGLPPSSYFPAGGRATPDISLLGEGYQVIIDGQLNSAHGTSASTPAFAAMVSLLNEARLQAGMKPMGYLNPFLYQNADAFTDVTVGTNAIGGPTVIPPGPGAPLKYGFQCTKGWDPVTGLGTPVFSKLLSAALATEKTMVHV